VTVNFRAFIASCIIIIFFLFSFSLIKSKYLRQNCEIIQFTKQIFALSVYVGIRRVESKVENLAQD
jgi:hypothetical protein